MFITYIRNEKECHRVSEQIKDIPSTLPPRPYRAALPELNQVYL